MRFLRKRGGSLIPFGIRQGGLGVICMADGFLPTPLDELVEEGHLETIEEDTSLGTNLVHRMAKIKVKENRCFLLCNQP